MILAVRISMSIGEFAWAVAARRARGRPRPPLTPGFTRHPRHPRHPRGVAGVARTPRKVRPGSAATPAVPRGARRLRRQVLFERLACDV